MILDWYLVCYEVSANERQTVTSSKPELAHPHDVLSSKAELVYASPKGGACPVDPLSVELYSNDTVATDFLHNHQDIYNNTLPLRLFLDNVTDFDAIFYVGGHGPMFDIVENSDSIQLIQEFYAMEKVVVAVCHGPAVLTNAFIGADPLVAGKNITGFSNAEEEYLNLTQSMPFLLEDSLKKRHGKYSKSAQLWEEHVVIDGRLITGQNPNSARRTAETLAEALGI